MSTTARRRETPSGKPSPGPRARGEDAAQDDQPRPSPVPRAEHGQRRGFARQEPSGQVLLVLVVLAALAAGWFGWSWWDAGTDDRLALARERDTVLRVAGEALVTLHSIDHRTAQDDIAAWLRVSTGKLADDLDGERDLEAERATKTKTVAQASVLRSAVDELNAAMGTARVMAVLETRIGTDGKSPQSQRRLIDAELTRTPQGWKISAVQPVE